MNGSALRVAACLGAFGATAVLGQTPAPTPKPTPWAAGASESIVSSAATGSTAPSVAVGEEGETVVAWSTGDAIFARRFDKFGAPLSGEFQVNTSTGTHVEPAVASRIGGSFMVVWSRSPDSSGSSDIAARFYDPSGAPTGDEVTVNTYTTGDQTSPRVDISGWNGTAGVVWSSAPASGQTGQDGDGSGVYARLYAFDGSPDGGEFLVNTYTTGDQHAASVTADSYGLFLVVWQSEGQDGDLSGIFGKIFLTVPTLGAEQEFQVNSQTAGAQSRPDAGLESALIVAWESDGSPGSSTDIYARQFQWSDQPLGPDFRVNTQTAGAQTRPRVADDRALGSSYGFVQPGYVVVWESAGQDDPGAPAGKGVFAQRFWNNLPDPTAQYYLIQPRARGVEYGLNTGTAGDQNSPDVDLAPDGQFVVAWRSEGGAPFGADIVARRFNFPEAASLSVDDRASSGTSNVNGVLEAGERVLIAPTWTRRGDEGLTVTGMASNITGPTGPTYTIDDAEADYGGIPQYHGSDCYFATGNCYEMTISGARPAAHWDATFDESPSSFGPPPPGLTKTWALHVGGGFPDVPQDAFYPYIESIFHNGVTAGGGCGVGLYCGDHSVSRQQMAVLLLKSAFGHRYVPSPATGDVFDDVAASSPFAPWIEDLFRRGIVAGCQSPPPPALPSYCPADPVNRQQTALLLYKMHWGAESPGACAGLFSDLPCSNPFAAYVERLAGFGVVAGCATDPPLYCPSDPTRRKQLAALLVKTFGLELYGPD